MKVLHIIAGNLDGGAARGAYWLHQGLLKKGIESYVLTDSEITFGDHRIISTTQTKKKKLIRIIRENLDFILTLPYRNKKNDLFSSGYFGVNLNKIPIVWEVDLIHLHWINSGFINIKQLKSIPVPLVWTIRDMWPLTGGCHVAEALHCDYYKTGCGKCKLLGSKRKNDLSFRIFRRKQKVYSGNIFPVGISNWMFDRIKDSLLFRDRPVFKIPNNIQTCIFSPIEKKIARNILRLETKKKIILCGATSFKLSHKGFDKFIEALKNLNPNDYFLMFFGKLEGRIFDDSGFEYRSLGFLSDNISLQLLYSSADVFVAPSTMESFGKTIGEAMACETPVVCFDATGPKDIVDHKENGYKAKPFDPEDLANGIKWVIQNNTSNKLGKAARKKVEREFSSEVIASQYVELYKTLLKDE